MDKVLAIEDDPAVQRALRRTFETAGYDVTIAPDGTSAMDVFRATTPRVVILDLRLPGRSGQDICREIKRHGGYGSYSCVERGQRRSRQGAAAGTRR